MTNETCQNCGRRENKHYMIKGVLICYGKDGKTLSDGKKFVPQNQSQEKLHLEATPTAAETSGRAGSIPAPDVLKKEGVPAPMDIIKHQKRHYELHRELDELVADFLSHTGKLPSQTTIMELIEWSYQQTINPQNPRR